MRTYTHGVIGYLLYAKRPSHERRLAVIGSLLPDALLGLGFIPHYAEYVTQAAIVVELHTLLHHSALHLVTIGLHSFVIVGPLLALAAWRYKPAVPLFVGMLAHGVVDLLTHQRWSYNHVFPLPFEPILAPFSYTDVGFTIVEHVGVLLFGIWWMWQRKHRAASVSPGWLQSGGRGP